MMRAVPEIAPTRQKLLERCFLLLWLTLSPGLASAVDWQMRYHEGNYGALTTELRRQSAIVALVIAHLPIDCAREAGA